MVPNFPYCYPVFSVYWQVNNTPFIVCWNIEDEAIDILQTQTVNFSEITEVDTLIFQGPFKVHHSEIAEVGKCYLSEENAT